MSADAGFALQAAIHARLSGDSALMALIAGLHDHVPADAAFPYVTVGEALQTDFSTKSFSGQVHYLTLHVFSRYAGSRECKEIMGALYALLHEANLAIPGQALIDGRFDFAQILLDPDGLTRHGVQRYRFVTQSLN